MQKAVHTFALPAAAHAVTWLCLWLLQQIPEDPLAGHTSSGEAHMLVWPLAWVLALSASWKALMLMSVVRLNSSRQVQGGPLSGSWMISVGQAQQHMKHTLVAWGA